jgi:hypothetical protein
MTTEVNLIELRSRQPGFDEIAWVMRVRSTDETQIAQCHQRFYFFFYAPIGAVYPGLLNKLPTSVKMLDYEW